MLDFLKKLSKKNNPDIEPKLDLNLGADNFPEQNPKRKDVPVIFPDGHIEEYAPTFRIEDGINCIVCSGGEYHYHKHFDCKDLLDEMIRDKTVKAFKVKDAEAQGKSYCYLCSKMDYYTDLDLDDL